MYHSLKQSSVYLHVLVTLFYFVFLSESGIIFIIIIIIILLSYLTDTKGYSPYDDLT